MSLPEKSIPCNCIVLRLQRWELVQRTNPDGSIRHDAECCANHPQPVWTVTQFDAALRCAASRATAKYAGEQPRIDRGLVIALNDGVCLTYCGVLRADGSATVQSASDTEVVYTVTREGCECKDSVRAPEGRCKHKWAVALVKKAQQLVREASTQTYYATYYAPSGEAIPGIATRDAGSRCTLFVPEDGGEPVYPAPEALCLGGLVALADAQAESDGDYWQTMASPGYVEWRAGK